MHDSHLWNYLLMDWGAFEERIARTLDTLELTAACERLLIDHACVRVRHPDDFTRVRGILREVGTEISAATVNGRTITITQLNMPFELGPWKVPAIELPHPKQNHRYEDGWEHVEFVVGGANTSEGVERFLEAHLNCETWRAFKKEHAGIYELETPHAEGDQLPNPTASIKFHNACVKFHPLSIQKVIGYH